MDKKTFEISNIQTVEELNALSLSLNEKEQVSHIKINKDSIVFRCIDIDALLSTIQGVDKEAVVKEVIDGQKRQYDFAQKKEMRHYFMFKNMITEDDVLVLVKRIEEDERYQDVKYDFQNKILMLTSSQKDVLSSLRKELYKINPSIEIFEHRKPIRSQDVFNQKYIRNYIRIAIFLVAISLAIITSKDDTMMTPFFWLMTMFVMAESLIKRVWLELKQRHFFKQDVLVFIALVMGIVSGAYVETCLAVIVYHFSAFFLNRSLERCLRRIDEAVKMPEKGKRLVNGQEEEISLYEFEIGDTMVVYPNETVTIPGDVEKGHSSFNTYSNTSTYDLKEVQKGTHVFSGEINVGHEPVYIKISETYESSNFIELMNIASVAPIYESKIEQYTKSLSRIYTPVMFALGIIVGVIMPLIDFREFGSFIHVGAVLVLISSVLSSEQSTSLGVLAGFARAFERGIIIESTLGLDSLNETEVIVYDRFDGVEVTNEELELFRKLSHLGKTLIVFNDGPVALENDQYIIYNDLTMKEKIEKMDSIAGQTVYIGDSFKDIELLQKSFVGISRGGLANSKVVENSDIVLIDSDLNKVYETFMIARNTRSAAFLNNILTIVMKLVVLIGVVSSTSFPLWLAVIIEILIGKLVLRISTYILE